MSISNTQKWFAMSDSALLELLGEFIRQTRLDQNKTQSGLSESAGINRSTLVQIEQGKGGNLLTFIQVLRALGKLEMLSAFESKSAISPLMLAEFERKKRKRARPSSSPDSPKSYW